MSEPGPVSENETSSLGGESQAESVTLPSIQSDSEILDKIKNPALFWCWSVLGIFLLICFLVHPLCRVVFPHGLVMGEWGEAW